MQAALGLSRGLHVQSMMYEHNYEIALHAQNRFPDRMRVGDRAVAAASPTANSTSSPNPAWSATASPGG